MNGRGLTNAEYNYRDITLESDQNLELMVELVLKRTNIEVGRCRQ